MVAHPLDDENPRMTEAEYLAFADEQEFKYEYSGGRVYAMSGGTVRHGVIAANTIGHLIMQLGERDCTVTSSDVRVYIAFKRAYRYPDVTVFCGEPSFLKGRNDTLTNPTVLVEVLSDSTALVDHTTKLQEYTAIESLQGYLIVSQDEPKVEIYRRHDDEQWLYAVVTGLENTVDVPIMGEVLRLSLAELYRRVRWDENTDDTTPDNNTP